MGIVELAKYNEHCDDRRAGQVETDSSSSATTNACLSLHGVNGKSSSARIDKKTSHDLIMFRQEFAQPLGCDGFLLVAPALRCRKKEEAILPEVPISEGSFFNVELFSSFGT